MLNFMIAMIVCVAIVAVGEVISTATKAFIPSMSASLFIYLVLTWIGMPKSFPDTCGFAVLGDFALMLILIHLGTNFAPKEYVKNWKSIIVAVGGIIGGLIVTVGAGGALFGFDRALAAAGAACGGGAPGGILAIQRLQELGLGNMVAVPAIILGTVDLFGQPIATWILKRYAHKLRAGDVYVLKKMAHEDTSEERLSRRGEVFGSADNPSSFITNWVPKKYESEAMLLLQCCVVGVVATLLELLTGLNLFIFIFPLSVVFCALGMFRKDVLDRANANGLVGVIFIVYLFTAMNDITVQGLLESIVPAVVIMALASLGLSLGAGIAGKILGYDFVLSCAAGMGLLFLMPGVLFVTKSVVASESRNEAEEEYMFNDMSPCLFMTALIGFIIGLGFTITLLLPLINTL